MEFEWDPRKDAGNRRKHDVGFREATTVFGDPLATTLPDMDHSVSEERFLNNWRIRRWKPAGRSAYRTREDDSYHQRPSGHANGEKIL
jgi:uncharacterized DUF497 family protein